MKPLDDFFLKHDDLIKECLLALKTIILQHDEALSSVWKYGMPFFYYKEKMFCYLWIHKKSKQPYIGIVEGKRLEHSALISEKRSRIKIILIDPNEDLPLNTINEILAQAIRLYKTGEIKMKH
jgi:hypothetical protein